MERPPSQRRVMGVMGQKQEVRSQGNLMDEDPKLAEEMSRWAEEPLLPIEKKLIGWSLALGVGLLGLLLWLSNTFFLAQP